MDKEIETASKWTRKSRQRVNGQGNRQYKPVREQRQLVNGQGNRTIDEHHLVGGHLVRGSSQLVNGQRDPAVLSTS